MKYKPEFIQNEDGTYFAHIPELPGCMTDSCKDLIEAKKMIDEAEKLWVETLIEDRGKGNASEAMEATLNDYQIENCKYAREISLDRPCKHRSRFCEYWGSRCAVEVIIRKWKEIA